MMNNGRGERSVRIQNRPVERGSTQKREEQIKADESLE